MVKKQYDTEEVYKEEDSTKFKHLNPDCKGKVVQEGSTGDHCAECGAWVFS